MLQPQGIEEAEDLVVRNVQGCEPREDLVVEPHLRLLLLRPNLIVREVEGIDGVHREVGHLREPAMGEVAVAHMRSCRELIEGLKALHAVYICGRGAARSEGRGACHGNAHAEAHKAEESFLNHCVHIFR